MRTFTLGLLASLSAASLYAQLPDPALVRDLNPTTAVGGNSSVTDLTPLGDALIFRANDGTGFKLWRTAGTPNATELLSPDPIVPFGLAQGPGFVIFRATTDAAGREPWTTDGTPEGTSLLLDIFPGSANSDASNFTRVGDIVFFTAATPNEGTELWRTDGTAAGTTLVRDILPGSQSANPAQLTAGDSVLFFIATDSTHGRELWVSDGTAAGTQLLRDIFPGTTNGQPNSSNPRRLAFLDGTLYLAATDSTGEEPWVSDGTTAGTRQLRNIFPGGSSAPDHFTTFGNRVFFAANAPEMGTELWSTDGTTAGTAMLRDIRTGAASSSPNRFVVFDSLLFFTAQTDAEGRELWRSDGTTEGTTLVSDINEGTGSGNPNFFVALDDSLFFSANDGDGLELWRTDGTAAGTARASSLNPTGNAAVNNLTRLRESIYFAANDGQVGIELWRYRVPYQTLTLGNDTLGVGDTLDFGTVFVNSDTLLNVSLANLGRGTLTVLSSTLSGDEAFQLVTPTFAQVPGLGADTLRFRFAPTVEGDFTAELLFRSDGFDQDSVVLVLTGNSTVTRLRDRLAVGTLEVYPNPSADGFAVRVPAGVATAHGVVTDALGRRIATFQTEAPVQHLSLGHLPAGMYYLTLYTHEQSWRSTLLKQ